MPCFYREITVFNQLLTVFYIYTAFYAALLRTRGPHIALHSVCPSVCPSVPSHRSRVFVNLADVRYLLFCLHVRAAYSTAISAAQACFTNRVVDAWNSLPNWIWLTVLTLLNAGWIHIGKTKRLSTIFMHSYKEPEVVVKCLDIIKCHIGYVKV